MLFPNLVRTIPESSPQAEHVNENRKTRLRSKITGEKYESPPDIGRLKMNLRLQNMDIEKVQHANPAAISVWSCQTDADGKIFTADSFAAKDLEPPSSHSSTVVVSADVVSIVPSTMKSSTDVCRNSALVQVKILHSLGMQILATNTSNKYC